MASMERSKPAAQYNLIEIDGGPDSWGVRVQRRGLMYGHEGVREIVAQTLLPAEEGTQKLIASRSQAK